MFYTCLCTTYISKRRRSKWRSRGSGPPPPPPEIKVTVAENSEQHSMIPTYNLRHALNTMFCLLSVSYLVGELFCCLHTTVRLLVCYINRQPGRGYHYSETNACGESAASKKIKNQAPGPPRIRPYSAKLTKPTKCVCVERRLRSHWACVQSDQYLLCA